MRPCVSPNVKINGTAPETVILPAEYANSIIEKLKTAQNAFAAAQVDIERARQMEREYLHMACNGKHTIDGLDNDTTTKICSWRGQFKNPYEIALAKYTQDMEQLNQKTELAERQRLTQQQLDATQRQLQHQEAQQLVNTLGQFGQQMRDSGQQMLNSVNNQPRPQVNFAPFTPLSGNQVRCVKIDPVINCRY